MDSFTSEDPDVQLEDWLPTLARAATWNNWSDEDTLMQLAGLRGRALTEWNLLSTDEKSNYPQQNKLYILDWILEIEC